MRTHPRAHRVDRQRLTLATCCLLLLVTGCASKGPVGFRLDSLQREIRYCGEYRDYVKLGSPKAWAVAGDADGVFVSGLAFPPREPGQAAAPVDTASAQETACRRCDARRVDRNVAAACFLHAIERCPTAAAQLQLCKDLPTGAYACVQEGTKCP